MTNRKVTEGTEKSEERRLRVAGCRLQVIRVRRVPLGLTRRGDDAETRTPGSRNALDPLRCPCGDLFVPQLPAFPCLGVPVSSFFPVPLLPLLTLPPLLYTSALFSILIKEPTIL